MLKNFVKTFKLYYVEYVPSVTNMVSVLFGFNLFFYFFEFNLRISMHLFLVYDMTFLYTCTEMNEKLAATSGFYTKDASYFSFTTSSPSLCPECALGRYFTGDRTSTAGSSRLSRYVYFLLGITQL
jgi:hypothetical protein